MTTLETLKAAHIAKATERWEDAVDGAMRFIHYENKAPGAQDTYYSHPDHIAAVRTFARRFLEVSGMVRFSLLGGTYYGREESRWVYYGDVVSDDPCSLLEFIRFFVGHEILDDGEPGIAYHKRAGRVGQWESCGPDDPDAQPYFHRCVDVLREKYPDAEWLSIERALEILNAADEEERAFEERFNALIDRSPDMFSHREKRGPSEYELQLQALAAELAEKP